MFEEAEQESMTLGDGGGDREKQTKWTKAKALRWWLRDERRGKGDRGLGDDACVSGMSNPGVVPQAAVYLMGLQFTWELDMNI